MVNNKKTLAMEKEKKNVKAKRLKAKVSKEPKQKPVSKNRKTANNNKAQKEKKNEKAKVVKVPEEPEKPSYLSSLPNELKCRIFKLLPGSDVSRCKRLSQQFSGFIDRNRGMFAKPTVNVGIKRAKQGKRGTIYKYAINPKKENNFLVSVDVKGDVYLIGHEHLEPFFGTERDLEDHPEFSPAHYFFLFLLKNTDIEKLIIWQGMMKPIIDALRVTKGRCFSVEMKKVMTEEKNEPLTTLCEQQSTLGVPIKLVIKTTEEDGVVGIFKKADTINLYAKSFKTVIVELQFSKILTIMLWLCKRWLKAPFRGLNCLIHMALDHTNQNSRLATNQILALDLELLSTEKKDLINIQKFHSFPVSYTFKNIERNEKIVFDLERADQMCVMTVDVKELYV